MAMLGNLVAILENVVPALGGKMTIIKSLFANLEQSTNSLGPIEQHTSKIHKKFILCPKNTNSIASFIFHICSCIAKNLNFLC